MTTEEAQETPRVRDPASRVEVRLQEVPGHDPRLEHVHNTRHASPRHRALPRHVGCPWLARFDWVLDASLTDGSDPDDGLVLTVLREPPGAVFCKAGKLGIFIDEVLPRLERPVVLYIGNGNFPLSGHGRDLRMLLGHPRVRHVFAENKDLDLPRVTAMPVGVHPADLLHDDGHRRLRELAGRPAAGRRSAVVVFDRGLDRFASALGPESGRLPSCFRLAPRVRSTLGCWQELSEHRFALIGWGRGLDTPGIFETLALGAVPILADGPLAEAYEGLPVVKIRDLSEITPGALERWWRELAPRFESPGFLDPGHWWRKVVRRLERPKRAFLVLGPESHGTHLVTDLLVRAGCHGHSGEHGSWHGEVDTTPSDRQPWDDAPPTDDPIVWRRSVPHLRRWPDLRAMIADLEARGYGVTAVVVHRDRVAAVRSQLKWGHVLDEATARSNIDRAHRHIFAHLEAADIPSIVVGYEALVHYPRARRQLLEDLGLDEPEEPLEVWDGNRKWHEGAASVAPAPAAERRPEVAFPEHYFLPDEDRWEAYERAVDRGRRRMVRSRVVLCGLARDVAAALPSVSAHVERIGALFEDHRVVVFENDSSDRTGDLLDAWAAANPRVCALRETLAWPTWERSTDRRRMTAMAEARNRCLDHVAATWPDFDHVIVLDLDLHRGFSLDGLATTFAAEDWDMVGSNGLVVPPDGPPPGAPMFFDAWSFRPAGDPSPQPFAEVNRLHLVRGEPLVPVASCFGGLAVYTMGAFLCGARYGGDDCEHVVFHRGLAERGFERLFLNPSQIAIYDPEPDGDEGTAP